MFRWSSIALAVFLSMPAVLRAQTSGPASPPRASGGTEPQALATPAAGTPEHDRLAPVAEAVRLEGEIELDGELNEAIWRTAPAVTRFLQMDPDHGRPASQPTEVRFVYDDQTLYIGARMYDSLGARGVMGRLARRDSDPPGDRLTITFDTFLDHLGQTEFTINPTETRMDAYGPGGSNLDYSWNPVWRGEAEIDSLGWTAEIAIPFAQLRFPRGAEQTWGLQIEREVSRLNEFQLWSFWTRDQQGGPARYGHLTGLSIPNASPNRFELLPYAVAQMETAAEIDPDDPFAQERDQDYRVGADLKYLLTSNLTVSATVNPDFGQAEVDPAVVNLSAFETFFPEKREFFIEGSGLFSYGGLWCFTCSNISSLDLLFTRRIGRAPQGSGLAFDAGDFADVPDATTILGAAKLTGRTRAGTSIGVLGAVTERERADVAFLGGEQFEQEVEPLTGYLVGRAKHDLLDGDLQVGGIVTSVTRSFDDSALEDLLPSHAEAVGADAEWWWGDRTYHYLNSSAISNVSGDPAAILRIQESSARYFQRPDRQYGSNGFFTDRYDPTLESIRGWATYNRVAKEAGSWLWETSLAARSPGFEINDLGFQTRTDFLWLHGNVQRRWTEPTTRYRYLQLRVGAQNRTNFDGDLEERQVHWSAFAELPNYWEVSLFNLVRPSAFDPRATRGGPVVKSPGHGFHSLFVATDSRKRFVASVEPTYTWIEQGYSEYALYLNFTYKPASNISLSLGPYFEHGESSAQYVTTIEDATAETFYGSRYVFSDLDQNTFSMNTRLDWTFTPRMSLELFLQPFFSSNEFDRFKEFAAPRTLDKLVYGEDMGTIALNEGVYSVDPDAAGPAETFAFDDPDFSFSSLRGNLVYRWEYVPGSTLFLVWTQDRNTEFGEGDFDLGRDADDLFSTAADNVFLVKLTYWLGI
ncbi:MAG TPA: DUF5916 domain-containing protein [Gemmatimonadota bacterium]|nr:DUF5916 domain-containing protein [Gemmatimonadota bacterium]